MGSTSRHQRSSVIAGQNTLCYCGYPVVEKTSWTNENPGRRFFGCALWDNESDLSCKFFRWKDPEVSQRTKEVILGLLARKKMLEKEIEKKDVEINSLRKIVKGEKACQSLCFAFCCGVVFSFITMLVVF